MHPKEFRRTRTGTGYLSHLCLKDSEVIVGLDFTKNTHFQELLADPQYFPALMYPGEDAITADTITQKLAEATSNSSTPQKKLLLIILDATWFCAKKMIK